MSLKVSTKRFQWSKRLVTFVAVLALLVQPMYTLVASRTASALGVDYTSVPFVLGEWVTDRATPTGGRNIVSFAGQANTLEMSLDKDLANMSGNGFYQTEGLKRTVALGTTALKASLYVDSDWITNGKTVRAGLWGTAQTAANTISAYPIVEFTTDGHTGWRSYNTVTGAWNNSTAAYNVNAWNTLEIRLDAATGQFTYLVNGTVVGAAQLNGSTSFKDVILNSKNYGPTAYNYSVRWSGFHTGSHVATAITNLNSNVVYDDLQAAVNAATPGDTLRLNENITTTNQTTITKAVTINGNGHTMFNARNNSAKNNSNNSIIGVQSNGVTINNLVIDGTGSVWMHGINVYEAKNVAINSVTLQNNSNAGMIVGKDAAVTVTNITTRNNGWYGINVDKKTGASSVLTVQGVSTHEEGNKAHIFIDDRAATNNTVNDPNLQYVRYWEGNGYKFVLDREKPTVALTVGAFNPSSFDVTAADDQHITRIDYSIWKDGTRIGIWGNGISYENPYNRTITQYCERVGATPGNAGTCVYHSMSSLAEGTYTLHATVVDVRGKSTNSTPVSFTVDRTFPNAPNNLRLQVRSTGSFISNNGWTNRADVTALWNGNNTEPVTYEYRYWNDVSSSSYTAESPWPHSTGSAASYAGTVNQGESKHYYCVIAVDLAGNRSACSAPFEFNYDKTAPDAQIVTPAVDGQVRNGIVEIKGQMTDINFDNHWFEIKGPNGYEFTTGAGHNNGTDNWTINWDTTGLEDGTYTIRYVAKDKAGNRNDCLFSPVVGCVSSPATRTVVIDNTAPAVDINDVPAGASPLITGTVDADAVGVEVSVDGGTTWVPAVYTARETTWSYQVTEVLANNTYQVLARATDEHGNATNPVATLPFTVAVVSLQETPAAETPIQGDDDPTIPTPIFLPIVFGGIGIDNGPVATPLLTTPASTNNDDDDAEVLGAEDTKPNWSVVNAALAGFVTILAVVGLAGIRRKETDADNNTGARIFMIVPAAAAVIAFIVIEGFNGPMIWFNVWTWLFAGILVVQAIVATLTTRTAND